MDVRYDSEKQRFVFDFEHDGQEDIVSLTGRRREQKRPKRAKPKFGDKNVPILLPNRRKSKNRI